MSELRPPRYLKPMNRSSMAMQKLGIRTGPAMVLTVPGRKTGKPRSTPMTPFDLRRRPVHRRRLSRRRLGGERPGGGCGHADPRAQVAASQDRRTERRRVTAGTARVPAPGSRRRRLRQALGAGTRRDARTSSRRSQANWRCSGSTRRARPATTAVARCTDNVAGAGPHVHGQRFVTVARSVGMPQVVAHSARMRPQVEPGGGALVDPDFDVATAGLHRHPAGDGGGHRDVAGRRLRVDRAVQPPDRKRSAGGPELDVAVSSPTDPSPDAVDIDRRTDHCRRSRLRRKRCPP